MRRSRVRELRFPLTAVFGGAAAVGLVACTAMAFAGVELGVNLTIVGLLLGLLLPLGLEIRNRSGRVRQVRVVDYRMHHYGHAVARGVKRVLEADRSRWHVTYLSTERSSADGADEWQVRQLQSAVIDDVDAVVLIPAGNSDKLWFALAAALKTGIFAVAVDTKPPNHFFRNVGIEAPRFVSADYAETGTLTGELLVPWLREDETRRAVLWIGPEGSWPGEERSRNIVYELASEGLLDRTMLQPIDSWTPEPRRCHQTVAAVAGAPGQVAVYCADDENAIALHLITINERPELRPRMYIIGCNGTPDDWGNIPSVDLRAVDATVDILAEEQGVQAAMLLVKERASKLDASERSIYIRPQLLIRRSSSERWMDALFDGRPEPEPEQAAPALGSRARVQVLEVGRATAPGTGSGPDAGLATTATPADGSGASASVDSVVTGSDD